jgi:sugar lactone lactonase YvrE
MSRLIHKPLFLLIGLVCSQASGLLRAQASYGIINTFAGIGVGGFSGDGGLAIAAHLDNPADVAIHPITGDIYIADQRNNRVRKVDSNGVITTVAGNAFGIDIDNVQAIFAGLSNPSSIAFDAAGNLYIADTTHHRIRRVNAATGIITTVAGTGDNGYNGDNKPATAAALNFPDHVALDSLGNLFIADDANNRVRRVDAATQIITTVAGTGDPGDNGDEQLARFARLRNPHGVMVDPAGNLFISDTGNHRVRLVDPSGVIHAYAGTGALGDSGDGGNPKLANLRAPIGLGRDVDGNIYIADSQSNRVRQVNASATEISTVAGSGISGYSGDGGPAEVARLSSPQSATINNRG